VVAILGPECGKSPLVKAMKGRIGALIYLDLEARQTFANWASRTFFQRTRIPPYASTRFS
jgi:hypothetical protein